MTMTGRRKQFCPQRSADDQTASCDSNNFSDQSKKDDKSNLSTLTTIVDAKLSPKAHHHKQKIASTRDSDMASTGLDLQQQDNIVSRLLSGQSSAKTTKTEDSSSISSVIASLLQSSSANPLYALQMAQLQAAQLLAANTINSSPTTAQSEAFEFGSNSNPTKSVNATGGPLDLTVQQQAVNSSVASILPAPVTALLANPLLRSLIGQHQNRPPLPEPQSQLQSVNNSANMATTLLTMMAAIQNNNNNNGLHTLFGANLSQQDSSNLRLPETAIVPQQQQQTKSYDSSDSPLSKLAKIADLANNLGSTSQANLRAQDSSMLTSSATSNESRCVVCAEPFPTLQGLTWHMRMTGHYPSAYANNGNVDCTSPRSSVGSKRKLSSSQAADKVSKDKETVRDQLPFPRKLVRGQDVWLGKGEEQTRHILKCMYCGESFRTLDSLTSHMQETKHYTKVMTASASPAGQHNVHSLANQPIAIDTDIGGPSNKVNKMAKGHHESEPTTAGLGQRSPVAESDGAAEAGLPCRLCPGTSFLSMHLLGEHVIMKHPELLVSAAPKANPDESKLDVELACHEPRDSPVKVENETDNESTHSECHDQTSTSSVTTNGHCPPNSRPRATSSPIVEPAEPDRKVDSPLAVIVPPPKSESPTINAASGAIKSDGKSAPRAESNPLAALQRICDKTESASAKFSSTFKNGNKLSSIASATLNCFSTNVSQSATQSQMAQNLSPHESSAANSSNSRSTQHGASTQSSMNGSLDFSPISDAGSILAFSWACNQVEKQSNVYRCPFCPTTFASKGAYRHHLSKAHFTNKDGNSVANVMSSIVSGAGNKNEPAKSPASASTTVKNGDSASMLASTDSGSNSGQHSATSAANKSTSTTKAANQPTSAADKYLKFTLMAKQLVSQSNSTKQLLKTNPSSSKPSSPQSESDSASHTATSAAVGDQIDDQEHQEDQKRCASTD